MALEPATKLGHYEILGPPGAGGLDEVHCAREIERRLGKRSVAS